MYKRVILLILILIISLILAIILVYGWSGTLRKNKTTSDKTQSETQEMAAADNPLDNVLKTGRPMLADFGRGKCIPCKMMKPILDELKEEYQGKAEILIIEIDEHPALTQRCRIRTIPTQIFYDASGKEVYRHVGFMPREDILEQLGRLGVR